MQLAADFFREKSQTPNTEIWLNIRNDLDKKYKAKQELDKRKSARKKKFENELETALIDVQSQEPFNNVEVVVDLRYTIIQRIANKFSHEVSRVGVTESEWLRRWAK